MNECKACRYVPSVADVGGYVPYYEYLVLVAKVLS